jgi:hypothetical protein
MIQTARGNTSRDNFGAVFLTPLEISTGGTYTFTTRSSAGSRLILRDSAGTIVFNLNNDFHQAATTRSGTVSLAAGDYTAELLYWQDVGPGLTLSATISGADTGGIAQSLGGYARVGNP